MGGCVTGLGWVIGMRREGWEVWDELFGNHQHSPLFPSFSLAMLPSVLFAHLFPELGCVLCHQPKADKPHLDFSLLFFGLDGTEWRLDIIPE